MGERRKPDLTLHCARHKVVAGTEIPGGGGKKEARPNSALSVSPPERFCMTMCSCVGQFNVPLNVG